ARPPPSAGRPLRRDRRSHDERVANFYLLAFVFLQMAGQVIFFLGAMGSLRVVFRCAAFGASLAMWLFVQGRGRPHPARGWALAVIVIVMVGLLHPTCNTSA